MQARSNSIYDAAEISAVLTCMRLEEPQRDVLLTYTPASVFFWKLARIVISEGGLRELVFSHWMVDCHVQMKAWISELGMRDRRNAYMRTRLPASTFCVVLCVDSLEGQSDICTHDQE